MESREFVPQWLIADHSPLDPRKWDPVWHQDLGATLPLPVIKVIPTFGLQAVPVQSFKSARLEKNLVAPDAAFPSVNTAPGS